MSFENYKTKSNVIIVYTGDSKGKTSASIGLMCRALGTGWKVAFIQFIKDWEVGEHLFIEKILPVFEGKLTFVKGGKGFFNAGELSAKNVRPSEHKNAARMTFDFALSTAQSGDYNLVICDEINNAVNDGLLSETDLKKLIETCAHNTSLCLTGRNFPKNLLPLVDIATNMTKIKHHFDKNFLANKGIDF